ncbi:MAG: FGGY family carbohydrate kinase, partial [Oscillospiraceae bacterium]
MSKYAIGIDFGTLSGRAVLVDIDTGAELTSSVYEYPHGVMDKQLPDGTALGHDWALQHPQDYIDVLKNTIPAILKESGVCAEDVIGVGTDFTACTVLPVKKDGTPLCFLPEFQSHPHAYVKLWKHHAAQDKATLLNEIAAKRQEPWLQNYGGKISSEWAIPKIWQIAEEDGAVYGSMDRFIEAADWIIWQLTGTETRNSCTAGYKEIWNKKTGYPSKDFFRALSPKLENVVEEKLGTTITPLGSCGGYITEKAAVLTGLKVGTAVAVGNVDAHVCLPAVGIDGPGKMLA